MTKMSKRERAHLLSSKIEARRSLARSVQEQLNAIARLDAEIEAEALAIADEALSDSPEFVSEVGGVESVQRDRQERSAVFIEAMRRVVANAGGAIAAQDILKSLPADIIDELRTRKSSPINSVTSNLHNKRDIFKKVDGGWMLAELATVAGK
jgi:predicted dinucleotide-utilizing enzyme